MSSMKDAKPTQTVKDLIERLKKFPQDMPIATYGEPFEEIVITKKVWTHNNYPYDGPDVEYIDLE